MNLRKKMGCVSRPSPAASLWLAY